MGEFLHEAAVKQEPPLPLETSLDPNQSKQSHIIVI